MKVAVLLITFIRSILSLKWRLRGNLTTGNTVENAISDYQTCDPSVDTCANSGSVCCREKFVLTAAKHTCRPATGCSGLPVAHYNKCSQTSNYCDSNQYVCCLGSMDKFSGTACRLPKECDQIIKPDADSKHAPATDNSAIVHSKITCQTRYTIVSGDTCNIIEYKTGVSVKTIILYNPSGNSLCSNLQIGQSICLSMLNSAAFSNPSSAQSPTLLASSSCPSIISSSSPSITSSSSPSITSSSSPSITSSSSPSLGSSLSPSSAPFTMSIGPSFAPSSTPITASIGPSFAPSSTPVLCPSLSPSFPPNLPASTSPSFAPSLNPLAASLSPSFIPSSTPVLCPSSIPSFEPSSTPVLSPSSNPLFGPSSTPLFFPSSKHSLLPSSIPLLSPSIRPSVVGSLVPSLIPSTPAPTNTIAKSSRDNQILAIVIAISVVIPLLVCLIAIFYFCGLSQKMYQDQKSTDNQNVHPSFSRYSSTNDRRTMESQAGLAYSNNGIDVTFERGREIVLPNLQHSTHNQEMSTLPTDGADRESYDVPVIPWSSLSLPSSVANNNTTNFILGRGSFGVVVKGVITRELESGSQNPTHTVAAIKVLLAGHDQMTGQNERNKTITAALEEARMVLNAHKKIKYKECITEVYGVARGVIPLDLCHAIGFADKLEGVGIVMRYEGGGTLQSLISRGVEIPIIEKLRLLKDIARGLAELHEIGIIHADLKPGNILLSESNPSQIRLADFGLSIMRSKTSWDESTWGSTLRQKGTPSYCAPELLFNPYNDITSSGEQEEAKVARPSRKTDVYAFAVVCWEVITQIEPYSNFRDLDIMSFTCRIQQGLRPDIKSVSKDYPKQMVDMIECCWSADRDKRKSAAECKSILDHQHDLLSHSKYDAYISYDKRSNQRLTSVMYNRLTELGLKVFYHDNCQKLNEPTDDVITCKAFVAIIGTTYSNCEECKAEIRKIKSISPPRLIIPVFTDPDEENWCNPELKYLLQLRSSKTKRYNISKVMQDESWLLKQGPSDAVYKQLFEHIDDIARSLTITLN